MDIVSHGLWGAIAFGRKNKKSFWLSFFFGIAPDLFSFGIFFIATVLGFHEWLHFGEPPQDHLIPSYVKGLYAVTHSVLVFAAAFILVWFVRKKPLWEMAAWGLHIPFDIFTHSYQFFPTPFLWPLFDVKVNGIPWSRPEILIPNVALLAALYLWFFVVRARLNRGNNQNHTI